MTGAAITNNDLNNAPRADDVIISEVKALRHSKCRQSPNTSRWMGLQRAHDITIALLLVPSCVLPYGTTYGSHVCEWKFHKAALCCAGAGCSSGCYVLTAVSEDQAAGARIVYCCWSMTLEIIGAVGMLRTAGVFCMAWVGCDQGWFGKLTAVCCAGAKVLAAAAALAA